MCSSKNLNDPEYEEIGDVGPPHARIFTIKCTVSAFVEKGTASTKKVAKHEAAKKMLERIKDVVWDDTNIKERAEKENAAKIDSAQTALNLFPLLSVANETAKSKVNWGLKVIKFHQEFKRNLTEEIKDDFRKKL